MRNLYRLIFYLGSFSCFFLLAANSSFGQCSISNLSSTYCTNDAAVTLSSTPAGLTFYRTGSASAITQFDPAAVGAGSYTVVGVNPTASTYNVITTGTFAPIAVPGTASNGPTTDGGFLPVSLPFNFYFFGASQSNLIIFSHGYIHFDVMGSSPNPQILPSSTNPDNIIAGAWEDLDVSEGGTIKYFTTGSAPFRKFVVDFNAVQYDGASTATVTFQIQLHETTNVIEIHSTAVQSEGNGNDRTQGIENADGSAGQQRTISFPSFPHVLILKQLP
jgi:hypothetical protein